MSRDRKWGARGEAYVVVQAALFVLIALGPRTWPGLPPFTLPLPSAARVLAIVLLLAGFLLVVAGVAWLRSNLSPLPYPRDRATLVQDGPFKVVRHPMYGGAILAALGWSLYVRGPLTLAYTILLFILFDRKSRREECWLSARFPDYDAYRQRVRRLIPFLY